PHIADPAAKPWEAVPWGFRVQSVINPEDLWEGFFCPAQNIRNTTSVHSGELDPFDNHDGYPTLYKYASAYMVNRILRSAVTNGRGPGTRWSRKPSDQFERIFGPQGYDNIFGSSVVWVDAGSGTKRYHIQATSTDELTNPAEIMYMCDSLDYRTDPSEVQSDPATGASYDGDGYGYQSAGMWYIPRGGHPPPGVLFGARHAGKANVLYADSHVSRDNQVPRNRRGRLVVASTFADFTLDRDMGSQFHVMPCWRRFGQR
ncbi:MAG: H-X9-DG-CTERM domain-containing protein, partial [Phycisphaerae bacterium]